MKIAHGLSFAALASLLTVFFASCGDEDCADTATCKCESANDCASTMVGECEVRACVAGSCAAEAAPDGTVCEGGTCDGDGNCLGGDGGGGQGGGTGGGGQGGGTGGGGGSTTLPDPQIFAGSATTCATIRDGELWCWGDTDLSGFETQPIPTQLPMQDTANIVISATHQCRMTKEGDAECWGLNNHGQLGDGTLMDKGFNTPVTGLPVIDHLAAGSGHTAAVSTAGAGFCWGDNLISQCTGVAPGPNVSLPFSLSQLGPIQQIGAGSQHSCARKDGGVLCWGSNLGDQVDPANSMTEIGTPVQVSGVTTATDLACGPDFNCVIDATELVCWGSTGFGQLPAAGPAPIAGFPAAPVDVEIGAAHTCVLLTDSTVYCFGNGGSGQLGDGNGTSSLTPVQVTGLPCTPIDIAAGSNHSCAICADATVACWGSNQVGQIGTGGTGGTFDTPQALPAF